MALGTTVQNSDGPVPMDVDCIWKGKGKDKGKNDRVKGDGKGWKGKGKNDKGARIRKVLGMQMVAGVKANIRCQTSLEKRPRRGKANLERARMDVGNVARLATSARTVGAKFRRLRSKVNRRLHHLQRLQPTAQHRPTV